jgi:hypothetical protein
MVPSRLVASKLRRVAFFHYTVHQINEKANGADRLYRKLTRIFLLRHELHADCVPIRCRLRGSSLEEAEGCELGGELSLGGTGRSWRYLLDIVWGRVTDKSQLWGKRESLEGIDQTKAAMLDN